MLNCLEDAQNIPAYAQILELPNFVPTKSLSSYSVEIRERFTNGRAGFRGPLNTTNIYERLLQIMLTQRGNFNLHGGIPRLMEATEWNIDVTITENK